MKHKILAYASLPVILSAGFLGVNIASAHGFFGGSNLTPDQIATQQQTMFQNEATLLGISVDDVKNGWAQGKSLMQIAQDHNITKDQLKQKMKDAQTLQIKARLKTLVDKGIITQAQMDQRLTFMQNNPGKGKMKGMGFGRKFWF